MVQVKLEKALKEAQKDRMAFYRAANIQKVYLLVNGYAYCCAVPGISSMDLALFTPNDVMAEDWELTTP